LAVRRPRNFAQAAAGEALEVRPSIVGQGFAIQKIYGRAIVISDRDRLAIRAECDPKRLGAAQRIRVRDALEVGIVKPDLSIRRRRGEPSILPERDAVAPLAVGKVAVRLRPIMSAVKNDHAAERAHGGEIASISGKGEALNPVWRPEPLDHSARVRIKKVQVRASRIVPADASGGYDFAVRTHSDSAYGSVVVRPRGQVNRMLELAV